MVESVKAASDVYSPVAGQVVASNDELAQRPELLNSDPYGAGWLMRVRARRVGCGRRLAERRPSTQQFLEEAE